MTSRFYFIPNFEVRSVTLLAALTVGTALVAHGQTTPPSAQSAPSTQNTAPRASPTGQDIDAAFGRADANKDGKLSRLEAARFPAVEQRFDQIDVNKDRFVSREEFQKALKS